MKLFDNNTDKLSEKNETSYNNNFTYGIADKSKSYRIPINTFKLG